jgi:hypothetical protein
MAPTVSSIGATFGSTRVIVGSAIFSDVGLINELRERGVEFVSLTEAIDTTTPTAALAELERSIIRERTRARIGSRAWAQRRPAEEAQ